MQPSRQMKIIDYQKTLRDIAKSMVRLKRPARLLKMITRFIDRELGLSHTSLLVLEEAKQRFIFLDSKGSRRFPLALIKIDRDHPLVQWFKKSRHYPLKEDALRRSAIVGCLTRQEPRVLRPDYSFEQIQRISRTMEDLKVELVIPGYYKETLLGLLLLGKKTDGVEFTEDEISFFQILAQDCSMAVKTAEYHQHLLEQNKELARRVEEIETLRKKERDTYYQIMRSLAQEVYEKDTYTYGHVSQVERLGLLTAKEMGLSLEGKRREILSAGLILHDVGKIGIPDHILKKPGPLTDEEWLVMKTHVEKGKKILEHLTEFKEVTEIVGCHHEHYNGSGYPRGLKGEQIPMEARIVAVVDAFHAIVSTRCYSKGRPVEIAFRELQHCAGTQFDPQVVNAFIRALTREMQKRGLDYFLDTTTDGSAVA